MKTNYFFNAVGRNRILALLLLMFVCTYAWGAVYTYDFTKGSSTSYWTSDNSSTSVGTSNIGTFYYMQAGYSGHCFAASGTNYRFNTTNNQQCFFLGNSGAKLTLPTYTGQLITSVTVYMRSGQGSARAQINIYSGSNAASTAQTASTSGVTFAISEDYQDQTLSLQVTNAYNTSVQTLVITTAVEGCEWSETFSLCAGTGGNSGGWNGSIANGTMVADNTGWTFSQEKAASQCGKFGTGSYGGSAQTPTLTGLQGTLTVKFKAGAWNAASEGTTLNLATTYGTLSQSSVTLAKGKWTDYTVTITGVTTATKITFSTDGGNKRFFLDDICVSTAPSCADPTGLNKGTITSRGATLSVTSSAANYDFYCTTSSGTPASNVTPTATASSAQSAEVNTLNYGTTYYYWARQNCGGGSTSLWVAGSGSTFTTLAPNTGLSITAGSLKPTKATFTIDDSNSPKINTYGGTYDIYYSTSDDTPTGSTVASRNESTLSWTATGLTAGTKYYYWVRGHGANANSSWVSGGNFTTPTLSSITVKTEPTTTTYFAGQTFSPTGLVITLHYSNSSTEDVAYSGNEGSFSFDPTTSTALTTSDAAVTITYGGKTVDQAINVYSVTVTKVDEEGETISADGVSASWTVGTKALAASATAGSKYVFKEWAFDGSNNGLSITSTSSANTTVTGTPTGNVTIKAVFYKPRTVVWKSNGANYTTGSPTSTIAYNKEWKDLKLPTDPTPPCGDKFMGWTTTNIGSTGLDVDDDASEIADLDLMTSGNKSEKTGATGHYITDATVTFYAVFADYNE